MGCDVHMWAEAKIASTDKSEKFKWVTVGRELQLDNDDLFPYVDCGWDKDRMLNIQIHETRNYVLFSFLADVRNGYGFGGTDTGNKIKPIDFPRGIPVDASPCVREEEDVWSGDGHHHSWLSLDELKNANWDQVITKRGIVTEEEYKEYLKNGKPTEWCSGIIDSDISTVFEDEYKELKNKGKEYYVKISWDDTLREYCKDFVENTIPKLEKLLDYENVLDIRIVFFFDN